MQVIEIDADAICFGTYNFVHTLLKRLLRAAVSAVALSIGSSGDGFLLSYRIAVKVD